MSDFIQLSVVVLAVAAALFFVARRFLRSLRGEGSCCSGGSPSLRAAGGAPGAAGSTGAASGCAGCRSGCSGGCCSSRDI